MRRQEDQYKKPGHLGHPFGSLGVWAPREVFIDVFSGNSAQELDKVLGQRVVCGIVVFVRVEWGQ